MHVDSTAYADFDFRNDSFHELQIWEVPKQIRIEFADTYLKLLEKLTAYFGRQPTPSKDAMLIWVSNPPSF